MSSAFAIAAVTRLMTDLINNALSESGAASLSGAASPVVLSAPDKVVGANSDEASQIGLFLHKISPNAALRNVDLPTRRPGGDAVVQRPTLALNLHYMLTAYGEADFHREVLLGEAALALHEFAVASRAKIRESIQAWSQDATLELAVQEGMIASRLAEQLDHIRIVPEDISLDDMSKVWTALLTSYRPSLGYAVSVVLLERQQPAVRPLPVLTRGAPDVVGGRDQGVAVSPSVAPPIPSLTAIRPPEGRSAARLGDAIVLEGRHLADGPAVVRFFDPVTGDALELAPAADPPAGDDAITVVLPSDPHPAPPAAPGTPSDPEAWRAGVYNIRVVVSPPGGAPRTTNALPMMLSPRMLNANAPGAPLPAALVAPPGRQVRFTVVASPPVRPAQDALLIVGDVELSMTPIAPIPPATEPVAAREIVFEGGPFPPGDPFVRLRVDGAESFLVDRAAAPPRFDETQRTAIP